jgi:hypothetical protein
MAELKKEGQQEVNPYEPIVPISEGAHVSLFQASFNLVSKLLQERRERIERQSNDKITKAEIQVFGQVVNDAALVINKRLNGVLIKPRTSPYYISNHNEVESILKRGYMLWGCPAEPSDSTVIKYSLDKMKLALLFAPTQNDFPAFVCHSHVKDPFETVVLDNQRSELRAPLAKFEFFLCTTVTQQRYRDIVEQSTDPNIRAFSSRILSLRDYSDMIYLDLEKLKREQEKKLMQ